MNFSVGKKMFLFVKSIWMGFAHAVGRINSIIILSIFFLLVIGGAAVMVRTVRHLKQTPAYSTWKSKQKNPSTVEQLTHQS